MLLNELLKAIQPVEVAGDSNIEITGVNIDSRLVEAGQLFMAMRGTQSRRPCLYTCCHRKGAIAILCEDMPEEPVAGITYVRVKRQRRCGRKDCHYLLRRPDFQVRNWSALPGRTEKQRSLPYYIIHSVISAIRWD